MMAENISNNMAFVHIGRLVLNSIHIDKLFIIIMWHYCLVKMCPSSAVLTKV